MELPSTTCWMLQDCLHNFRPSNSTHRYRLLSFSARTRALSLRYVPFLSSYHDGRTKTSLKTEDLFLIQETWTDIDVLESAILPTECSPSASETPWSPAPSLVIDERQSSPEETPVDNEFIDRFILRPVTPSDWERESAEPESLQVCWPWIQTIRHGLCMWLTSCSR